MASAPRVKILDKSNQVEIKESTAKETYGALDSGILWFIVNWAEILSTSC